MKPTLAELQTAVLKAITEGDTQILGLVRKPPNDTAEVMFGVYGNGYYLRLEEFLRNDQPRLHAYLGDDQFRAMTRAYATAHPSDTPNARWYSRHLPEFLSAHAPWKEHAEAAELAELERALNAVFDAPDAPVFTTADLQSLDHSRIGEATIAFQPALELVTHATNAGAIWTALKNEEPPPEVEPLREPATLLVWRMNAAARWRVLGAEEAMALSEARAGVNFGVLCEMIAFMAEPDTAAMRAATYLRSWLDAGMLSAITTPEP